MPDPADTSTPVVNDLLDVLNGPYRDALSAHLEYQVYAGIRNMGALEEFEAALSHVAGTLVNNDAGQIPHIESHCQRIATEMTEIIAETYLDSIRSRFDPYYKHPRVAKFLLLTKPSFLDSHYGALREIQEHIFQGRLLKGKGTTYQQCLGHFKQALRLAKDLDKMTPMCPFGERLFAVVLSTVALVLGVILGWVLS